MIELDIPSNPIAGQDQTPPSNLPNPNPQTATDAPPSTSEHVQDPEA